MSTVTPIDPTSKTQARAIVKALRPGVDTLLLATAHAQLQREAIDAIKQRVLDADEYLRTDRRGNSRVTDPGKDWAIRESQWSEYYAKLADAVQEAGYKVEREFCPALIAEELQIKAENSLIKTAETFFPNMTNNQLLCGTDKKGGLELRQEWIDLLIGLVVRSPGYRSPLKRKGASR